MRILTIIIMACAMVLPFYSCNKDKKAQEDNTETVSDEKASDALIKKLPGFGTKSKSEAEPVAEPVAEPTDESEGEVITGPSDVDMVDIKLTEPAHVSMLLDQFDYDINLMAELIKDRKGNAEAIEQLSDHIIKITEKMNEAAQDGICSVEQMERYQDQAEKFLQVVNQ